MPILSIAQQTGAAVPETSVPDGAVDALVETTDAATPAIAAAAAEPNWLVILGLMYAGLGVIWFASAVSRGAQWSGSDAGQIDRASGYQRAGVWSAALLVLSGFFMHGLAQFQTLAMGPTVALLILAIIPVALVLLFISDVVADPLWGRSQLSTPRQPILAPGYAAVQAAAPGWPTPETVTTVHPLPPSDVAAASGLRVAG